MLRLPCTPRVSDRSAASQVIEAETRATTRWELSAEGEEVLRDGSPEVRLFRSVPSEGLPQSDAMVSTAMGGRGGVGGGGLREHRASHTALNVLPSPRRSCPVPRWASARPWPTSGCASTRGHPAAPAFSVL